jgi:type II secretory pathway component PulJ
MDPETQRGQALIELLITVSLLAGFFLVSISLSESASHAQKRHRFESEKLQPRKGGSR